MFMIPEDGKDFEAQIIGFDDGGSTNTFRTANGQLSLLNTEIGHFYTPKNSLLST
jgi:hypothetical protein